MREIMMVPRNIVSPQANKPVIGIVQVRVHACAHAAVGRVLWCVVWCWRCTGAFQGADRFISEPNTLINPNPKTPTPKLLTSKLLTPQPPTGHPPGCPSDD